MQGSLWASALLASVCSLRESRERAGKMGLREYFGGGAICLALHWPLLTSESCSVSGGMSAGWRTFCWRTIHHAGDVLRQLWETPASQSSFILGDSRAWGPVPLAIPGGAWLA